MALQSCAMRDSDWRGKGITRIRSALRGDWTASGTLRAELLRSVRRPRRRASSSARPSMALDVIAEQPQGCLAVLGQLPYTWRAPTAAPGILKRPSEFTFTCTRYKFRNSPLGVGGRGRCMEGDPARPLRGGLDPTHVEARGRVVVRLL
eukprot:scaffold8346_cov119-Isochrysis_galbana.AAC.3